MCTCFINRGNDLIIAMNFDNNGMEFELNTKVPKSFVIEINTDFGKQPSFGINSEKIFVNNLYVDSNGKGLYKRTGKTRTLTTYLVKDILEGKIIQNGLNNYLDKMEIVNAPNLCTHNLVVDENGNIWVIEPGRGKIKNEANDSHYYIMTNFSLIDFEAGKKYSDNGFDRYMEAKNNLAKRKELSVADAFDILEKVKQKGEWKTDFSMVYSKKESKVFYCYNAEYKKILEYNLS